MKVIKQFAMPFYCILAIGYLAGTTTLAWGNESFVVQSKIALSAKRPVSFLYDDSKLFIFSIQSAENGFNGKKSYTIDIITNNSTTEAVISNNVEDITESYYLSQNTSLYWSTDHQRLEIISKKLTNSYSYSTVRLTNTTPKVKDIIISPKQDSFTILNKNGTNIISYQYPKNFSQFLIKGNGKIHQNSKIRETEQTNHNTIAVEQLTDDNFAVALGTIEAGFPTAKLRLYNNQFTFLRQVKFTGFLGSLYPMKGNRLLVLHFFDEQGEDAEAMILDEQLNTQVSYKVPSFYELANPQGDLKVLHDGTILHSELKRTDEITGEIIVKLIGPSGEKSIIVPQSTLKGLIDTELINIEKQWYVIGISLDDTKNPQGTIISFHSIIF